MKPLSIIYLILFVCVVSAFAQEDVPASRSITSLDFKSQRQPSVSAGLSVAIGDSGAKRAQAIAALSNPKRRYNLVKRVPAKRVVKPVVTGKTPKLVFKNEELGVTFWRMRPLNADDENAPLFPVKIDAKRTESWTAERVASTTEFKKGDRVRFTIESSRSGFLYIVNREFYADGTSGAANVIFPTHRIRGGNNRVEAGSLIEIPASTDAVPYLTVTPRRADYAGEELVVLILPNELPNFEIGLRAQPVTLANLEKWSNDWESLVDIYDAEDGIGTAYTKAESLAANVTSRALTQEEPLPQTIYKVRIKENMPLFVPIRMKAVR